MGREDWRKDLKVYLLTIWSTATLQEVQTVTDITFSMARTEKKSEEYGFVIPLAPHLHEFTPESVHGNPNSGLDLELKQMAQRYFEEHYGTREEFIQVFGKNRL